VNWLLKNLHLASPVIQLTAPSPTVAVASLLTVPSYFSQTHTYWTIATFLTKIWSAVTPKRPQQATSYIFLQLHTKRYFSKVGSGVTGYRWTIMKILASISNNLATSWRLMTINNLAQSSSKWPLFNGDSYRKYNNFVAQLESKQFHLTHCIESHVT